MRNVYSGAGAKPKTGPVPKSRGLRYKDPFPGGGICLDFTIISSITHSVPSIFRIETGSD